MNRALLVGLSCVVALSIGFAWWTKTRNNELDRRLQQTERQVDTLRQEGDRLAGELAKAVNTASAAVRSAEESASRAVDAATARSRAEELAAESEQEKQRAEQERQRAEQERLRAESEAQQSRRELDDLRQRREQELSRMSEALGRIAPTRRTASGIVVELAEDSFHFDFDKATLRPENREILSRIAGVLLVSNGYRLSVHGHTDDIGTDEYNQQLSRRRAEVVGDYLKAAGVAPEVIEVRGFGKSSPRDDNKTREARQKNRRVEIAIVDSVVHYEGVAPSSDRT